MSGMGPASCSTESQIHFPPNPASIGTEAKQKGTHRVGGRSKFKPNGEPARWAPRPLAGAAAGAGAGGLIHASAAALVVWSSTTALIGPPSAGRFGSFAFLFDASSAGLVGSFASLVGASSFAAVVDSSAAAVVDSPAAAIDSPAAFVDSPAAVVESSAAFVDSSFRELAGFFADSALAFSATSNRGPRGASFFHQKLYQHFRSSPMDAFICEGLAYPE